MGFDVSRGPSPRKEGGRKKNYPEDSRYYEMMYKSFLKDLEEIDEKFYIIDGLEEQRDKDAADYIRRSQVLFLTSTLDNFMHEAIRFGMKQVFVGKWKMTNSFLNYQVPFRIVFDYKKGREDSETFIDSVDDEFRRVTLTYADQIKGKLQLVGLDINISKELDSGLRNLNRRRNAIAHQNDALRGSEEKTRITSGEVRFFISLVKEMGALVDSSVRSKGLG